MTEIVVSCQLSVLSELCVSVATMSVGSTRQLVIPSELGYGATGA
ncbi:MAG: FKBP-type peptidyl-prolyl cis-trans isomerase, partial [Calditrichaeota bacterium]|nr:FKBP-type peptidyl-prolyl cis-trans isomerase [Calditrichota bacterium]